MSSRRPRASSCRCSPQVLIVSAVSRLMTGMQLQVPHVIGMVLSIILIVAAFVMTLVLTVQRFYKNLLTDEGYLMFTLPVSVGNLITGKLIVAAVWNIVCTIVAFLSVALLAFTGSEWHQLALSIRELDLTSLQLWLYGAEFGVLVLASLLTNILMIYACMALSMLANKHRVWLAFGFYVALNTLLQILISIVLVVFAGPESLIGDSLREFFISNAEGAIHLTVAVSLALTIAFGAGMYCTTRYMLKNRLNLQ